MNPRLFAGIASLEARKTMSYRADFWINAIVGFVAQVGIVFFLWQAIFAESGQSEIRGYTFESMMIYMIAVFLLGKLVHGAEHQINLAADIYDGGLTRYIVYPTDYLWFKYAQHLGQITPFIVQIVLFGIFIPFLFTIPPDVVISLLSVLMAAVSILFANLLCFLVYYPIQGVAFWADNVWSLNVMGRMAMAILGGLMLPIPLFPEWAQRILYLLPFPYIYYLPAETLLGRISFHDWFTGLAVCVGWIAAFLAAGRVVWKRGNYSYTGVGI